MARKVLLSGDPEGRLGALFKRVAAVNKSNGPFDMLLCVGSFFPPGDEEAEVDSELSAYLTGAQAVPVPTYFVGSFGAGSRRAMAALAVSSTADVTYLGRSGLTKLKGLSVAFLDGTFSRSSYRSKRPPGDELAGCRHYTEADVVRLKQAVERADGDVDLLLTCDWPAGVTAGAAPVPDAAHSTSDDPIVAELAVAIRPRYHVAGGKGAFYARAPYMNKDLGAGAHATRFIGLAPVGNAAKQKFLHALALVPAVDMDQKALTVRPDGATDTPYGLNQVGSKRPLEQENDELGAQSWRWQDKKKQRQGNAAPSPGRPGVVKDDRKSVYVRNLPFRATEEDLDSFFSQVGHVVDVRRGANSEGKLNGFGHIQFETEEAVQRALKLHGSDLMGRELFIDAASNRPPETALGTGKPVEGCWFCLSNPDADVNLIASIGEESYVAVDKGAINWGHVLMLPVEHYRSGLVCPASTAAEMGRYMAALRLCYKAQGQELVAFERYMTLRKSGGNHCHVNALPIPAAAAAGARKAFEKEAATHGAVLRALAKAEGEAGREALRDVVGDGEYFHVHLPDGSQLAHPILRGERFPLNFGRTVVAALVGKPERADWKKCEASPAEEEKRTADFKEKFKAWDPM